MILTLPTTDAHGATNVLGMVKPRSLCRFITGRCLRSFVRRTREQCYRVARNGGVGADWVVICAEKNERGMLPII